MDWLELPSGALWNLEHIVTIDGGPRAGVHTLDWAEWSLPLEDLAFLRQHILGVIAAEREWLSGGPVASDPPPVLQSEE